MKENGTRRIAGAPARHRRAATVLFVGWVSCCAALICDRLFLSGSGALSAVLFYTSLLALAACSLRAGRLLYSRPAPAAAAVSPGLERANILENLPCFVASLDGEGMNDYTNRRLLDYVGKGSSEVAGHRWMDTIHPDEREQVRGEWLRCAAAGVAMEVNHRMLRHDGSYRWFHARVEPSFDGRGGVARWHAVLTDIDERVRAEESLRERERQLREMVDAIPGMLVVTSPGGEVEYINEPVRKMTGRSLESLRDLGWASMIHPEDVEELKGRWLSAVETGVGMNPEYRQLCADGSYRWWQIRIEPFRDGGGEVTRWYGVITDIDDRKRAEEALRERERQLRQMVDTIPAMLFVAAPDGEIEYANQPLLDFLGQGVEALRGRGWVSMIHPDDAETQVNRWLDMVATGGSLDTEFRVRRIDGAYRWFHSRVGPLRDGEGGVIRWYGAITDIDDRRRADEALRESEHQLRLTVETISALVWRATPQGWIDYVNQRGLDYTGRSLRDFAITGWLDLVHPEDAGQTLRLWQHSFETGEPFVNAYRFRGADGIYRWFQVRAEPLRDEEGRVTRWYGLHIDVDEGRRMEEELRRSRERLAASMRLAALAELSASIAHEINQPLGALVTNCHACQGWLAGDPPNVERARLVLDRVVRDGNAAADVVRKIRALFKETVPAKELLDVNVVVVEAHRLVLEELRRKKVNVELELGEGLPPVSADRVQLQQVLVNLMHNGADSMETVRGLPRVLTVRTGHDGADVVVEVTDRGGGLQDVRRVFEPFFTTKEGGMGVGLAICRSIVEAHGGRIRAENREHGGAAFTFTLPADTGGER